MRTNSIESRILNSATLDRPLLQARIFDTERQITQISKRSKLKPGYEQYIPYSPILPIQEEAPVLSPIDNLRSLAGILGSKTHSPEDIYLLISHHDSYMPIHEHNQRTLQNYGVIFTSTVQQEIQKGVREFDVENVLKEEPIFNKSFFAKRLLRESEKAKQGVKLAWDAFTTELTKDIPDRERTEGALEALREYSGELGDKHVRYKKPLYALLPRGLRQRKENLEFFTVPLILPQQIRPVEYDKKNYFTKGRIKKIEVDGQIRKEFGPGPLPALKVWGEVVKKNTVAFVEKIDKKFPQIGKILHATYEHVIDPLNQITLEPLGKYVATPVINFFVESGRNVRIWVENKVIKRGLRILSENPEKKVETIRNELIYAVRNVKGRSAVMEAVLDAKTPMQAVGLIGDHFAYVLGWLALGPVKVPILLSGVLTSAFFNEPNAFIALSEGRRNKALFYGVVLGLLATVLPSGAANSFWYETLLLKKLENTFNKNLIDKVFKEAIGVEEADLTLAQALFTSILAEAMFENVPGKEFKQAKKIAKQRTKALQDKLIARDERSNGNMKKAQRLETESQKFLQKFESQEEDFNELLKNAEGDLLAKIPERRNLYTERFFRWERRKERSESWLAYMRSEVRQQIPQTEYIRLPFLKQTAYRIFGALAAPNLLPQRAVNHATVELANDKIFEQIYKIETQSKFEEDLESKNIVAQRRLRRQKSK